MSMIAQCLQILRQQCEAGIETFRFLMIEVTMLSACVYWISSSHQSCSGGSAQWLDIALFQSDPGVDQGLHVRSDHVHVVPGHIIVSQVIRQDQHNVGLLLIIPANV